MYGYKYDQQQMKDVFSKLTSLYHHTISSHKSHFSELLFFPSQESDKLILQHSLVFDHDEVDARYTQFAYIQHRTLVHKHIWMNLDCYYYLSLLEKQIMKCDNPKLLDPNEQQDMVDAWLCKFHTEDPVYRMITSFITTPRLQELLLLEKVMLNCIQLGFTVAAIRLLQYIIRYYPNEVNMIINSSFIKMCAFSNNYALVDMAHRQLPYIGMDKELLERLIEFNCVNTCRWMFHLMYNSDPALLSDVPVGNADFSLGCLPIIKANCFHLDYLTAVDLPESKQFRTYRLDLPDTELQSLDLVLFHYLFAQHNYPSSFDNYTVSMFSLLHNLTQ